MKEQKEFQSENLKVRELERPKHKKKITLRRILNRIRGCGLEQVDLGHANIFICSTKVGGFLASLVTISFSSTLLSEAV